MAGKADREGLSIWYRISYRIRYLAMSLFGPAQLSDAEDPRVRLVQERKAKVAAARAARLAREADQGR